MVVCLALEGRFCWQFVPQNWNPIENFHKFVELRRHSVQPLKEWENDYYKPQRSHVSPKNLSNGFSAHERSKYIGVNKTVGMYFAPVTSGDFS
jgi:hypothetical protein